MALKEVSNPSGVIHHSDRGSQYCCHEFIKELHKHGMVSSMTDENHCYQNAVAERLNGILKDEFYLDIGFSNVVLAEKATKSAIHIYNTIRPHESLRLNTPEFAYREAA